MKNSFLLSSTSFAKITDGHARKWQWWISSPREKIIHPTTTSNPWGNVYCSCCLCLFCEEIYSIDLQGCQCTTFSSAQKCTLEKRLSSNISVALTSTIILSSDFYKLDTPFFSWVLLIYFRVRFWAFHVSDFFWYTQTKLVEGRNNSISGMQLQKTDTAFFVFSLKRLDYTVMFCVCMCACCCC